MQNVPAAYLYTGPYFKMNLRWARSNWSDDRIFIMSGKYGLLRLKDKISYYDLKMHKDHMPLDLIKSKIIELNLKGKKIYALGGKIYLNAIRLCFGEFCAPVAGVGMGYQMGMMKKNMGKCPAWKGSEI